MDKLRGASSLGSAPPPKEGMLRVAMCECDIPEPPFVVAGDEAGNLITSTRSIGEPDLLASSF
jgi:hypothetical protein